MSIISFTGQIKEKKWNLFDFWSDPSGSRSGSESAIPGTGSATPGTGSADPDPDPDPDPHQNEMDPKHC